MHSTLSPVFCNRSCPAGHNIIPCEGFGQEFEHVAFVIGIGVLKVIALGFQSNDPLFRTFAARCKNEIGIDAPAFPALKAISRNCDVSVPPADCSIAV